MSQRFSDEELYAIRTFLEIRFVIESVLHLPHKEIEGVYRFQCPLCAEMSTGIHPHMNMGRCFRCESNFNPIDLVKAAQGLSFVESVKLLRKFVGAPQTSYSGRPTGSPESRSQRIGQMLPSLLHQAANFTFSCSTAHRSSS